ncbi:inorganic pyrophosphatase [Kushneria pakistanensis]|uniref:Inorganic pyrophosphatase n=1 Tax=Kushneria pakistanensis TaxID=1508770 RepID=A0ABQ3FGC3_9GAMM|nr:inorganic diphosphatase [Kushneria pakistanensis]GHC23024.1 inorganic pyrophosphatase [Kushneria pakistanensis]
MFAPRRLAAALLATATLVTTLSAQAAGGLADIPQPEGAPETFLMVNEIPAGSAIKYELDEAGHVIVDRFLSMPMAYPANYGSIPSSLGGDGDPLDVMAFTRTPIVPGAIMAVRPIGMLRMIDGGEADDKIIAVPTHDVDPTWDEVKSLDDLPAMERERLEGFFRVYKQLPEGSKVIELKGFAPVSEAHEVLQRALEDYRSRS